MAADRPFRDIRSVLRSVVPDRAFGEAADLKKLSEAWQTVVPAEAVGHTRPASFHGSSLIILVDHPVWKTELSGMKKEIAAKAAKIVPGRTIVDIDTRLIEHFKEPR